VHRRRGREEWRRGKSGGGEGRAEHRVAPLLGVIHDQVESDLSPHVEEDVRVGRETEAAQEVERRRVRLPRAAILVRSATTTPPTQHEPTRSLSLLLCRSFPCSRHVSTLSSRCAPVRHRFSHERSLNRASSIKVLHSGDPTPSLLDAFVRMPFRCARFWSGRGTPHDAPSCRVPGAAPCLAPLCSGLRTMCFLCRWMRACVLARPHPNTQGQGLVVVKSGVPLLGVVPRTVTYVPGSRPSCRAYVLRAGEGLRVPWRPSQVHPSAMMNAACLHAHAGAVPHAARV
jgi:hypothetical protein